MKMLTRISGFAIVLLLNITLKAQDTSNWKRDFAKLNHVHSTMFVGVNPSDIDTNIAKKIHNEYFDRVAFLSVTRGESIGVEPIEKSLNFIQRSIYQTNKALTQIGNCYDNLYFTRAFDIPTTSNADSTEIFKKSWNRKKIIGDLVWCIRTFQPDQIIFSDKLVDTGTQYLYIRNMIQDACIDAADSSFYKEQFDDSRYPWKTKIVSSTQDNSTSATWSVVNSYNDFYQKQLDSVRTKELSKSETAHFLYNFRLLMDSLGYSNPIWFDYKVDQVNNFLLKYSNVNIGGAIKEPLLISGNIYHYNFHYSGDQEDIKLRSIRFGQLDTSLSGNSFSIDKYSKLSSKEIVTQPYWLTSPMETPGMYDVEFMQALDYPVNPNPFTATFLFAGSSHPLRMFYPLYVHKTTDTSDISQTPVITIPGFMDISPNVIISHLKPQRNEEHIVVGLQSNMDGNLVPIKIILFQKGVKLKIGDELVGESKRIILMQKDTVCNLKMGERLQWGFDISTDKLSSNNGSIGAEVFLGDLLKTKINSSLNHVSLPNMPDIDYHFQPKIMVLNKDTIALHSPKKLLVLGDSIPSANQSLINYALSILHIPYQKKNQQDHFSLDSLRKNSSIILQGAISNSLDSLFQQYVIDGGRLILFPTDGDSIPSFINDSLMTSNIILYQHDSLYVETLGKDNNLSNPNKITSKELTSESIISTYSWQGKGNNVAYPILFKNNHFDSNEIHPLVVWHYGEGTVVLCGLHFDMSSLEKSVIEVV